MKIYIANFEELVGKINKYSLNCLLRKEEVVLVSVNGKRSCDMDDSFLASLNPVGFLKIGLWGAEINLNYEFAIDESIIFQLIKECEKQNLYYRIYTKENIISSIPNQIMKTLITYAEGNGKNDFERLFKLVPQLSQQIFPNRACINVA